MADDRVSATRVIHAPAAAVFAVLTDPATHAAIDGTGWVCETVDSKPLTAAGQIFRMSMYHPNHPDGNYRRLAVRDPAATPALIERLSHDPAVWTRQAAAGDPRLPLHRLREALHVPELASSAGANPALPEDEMAAVLNRAGVPRRTERRLP